MVRYNHLYRNKWLKVKEHNYYVDHYNEKTGVITKARQEFYNDIIISDVNPNKVK